MEKYQTILEYAKEASLAYIEGIDESPTYPPKESLASLQAFEEEMPSAGTDALTVLQLLNTLGAKNTTAAIGGRYFGFVTGGLLPVAHGAE